MIMTHIVQSQSEWKNINDIIRLKFIALIEVVKSQGEKIEKQLSTRTSKNELHSGLSLKANINDISRTIAEIAANLDTKITYEGSQVLLKDYVLNEDMQYLLSNKIDIDEMKQLLEKQQSGEFKGETKNLKHKSEELQTQISKKFQQVSSQFKRSILLPNQIYYTMIYFLLCCLLMQLYQHTSIICILQSQFYNFY